MTSRVRVRSEIAVAALVLACTGQIEGKREIDPTGIGAGGGGSSAQPPPSSPAGAGPTCDRTRKAFAPARLWQLTDDQYANVVRDVLGVTLSDDDRKIVSAGSPDRYTNYSEGISIDSQVTPNYQAAASKVADLAQARMSALLGSSSPTVAQLQVFLTQRLSRAWRRPVSDTEVAALTKIYQDALPDGAARGFHLVLEAALQAPSFLYRTELGDPKAAGDDAQLGAYELASALSFLFLESAPDDALWAAAQAGTLDQPAGLAAEVDRLMKLPAARANMTAKAAYWLGLAGIRNRGRNATLYPEWNETLKSNLADSVQLFLADVIGGGKLSDLFTSNRVYVNGLMSQLYGIPGGRGSTMTPVMVTGSERAAGILSQPGLIVAANRNTDRADVVHRGLMVWDGFICGGAIPPAPPNAGDEAKKMDGTERERAQGRDTKPACLPCHSRFDPPGLTFSRYDALGRYQEMREAVLDSKTSVTSWVDDDKPLDASAELSDDGRGDGVSGHVNDLNDLAAKLAAAPVRVGNCASRRLAEYALGFDPAAENGCELQAVKEVLVQTGSFIEFFRALALSPGFRARSRLPLPQL